MGDLCREYGISRKTGHKIKARFEQLGTAGLFDESRAPKHVPHKTRPEVEELVVAERRRHPTWGAKKLKDVLERRLGHALPAASTLGIRIGRRKVHLSTALAGQRVGIREENDGRWLVSFVDVDLGHVDRQNTLIPHTPLITVS